MLFLSLFVSCQEPRKGIRVSPANGLPTATRRSQASSLPGGATRSDEPWRCTLFRSYDRPVRCREGHLFTTIWMPWVSFKAVRLSDRRYQRCPVGRHWMMVYPLRSNDPAELAKAAAVRDVRIP